MTFLVSPVLAGGDAWVADFDKAASIAKKAGKDLMVDFTGSDWCGWCIKLDKEVFAHEAFLTSASKDFVLVKLDFPRAKEIKDKVPDPERNQELMKKHGISGYPTVLLMTADGEEYGRTGYVKGGPTAFLAKVNAARSDGRAAVVRIGGLIASYEKAEGGERTRIWASVMSELEGADPSGAGARRLAQAVRASFDGLDKAQQDRVVKALVRVGQVDAPIWRRASKLDPRNTDGLFERAVFAYCDSVQGEQGLSAALESVEALEASGEAINRERTVKLYANAAYWCQRFLDKPDEAKRLARKARGMTDDLRLQSQLDAIIDA
jgi:thiol-disulfide isomerase/thioredoxin